MNFIFRYIVYVNDMYMTNCIYQIILEVYILESMLYI